MPMPMPKADFDMCFRDFGVTGAFTVNEREFLIIGIFDHEFVLIGDVETRAPTFHIDEDHFIDSGAAVGTAVKIERRNYKVVAKESDGHGMIKLILQET